MTNKLLIDAVVVLEGDQARLRACIAEKRPDLGVYDSKVDKQVLKGKRYAIIAFNPGDCINDFPDVAWIHCSGAGVDHLLGSLQNRVPLVTRTIGRMGEQIAEYVLAYMLSLRQQIAVRTELQKLRRWDPTAASPQFLSGSAAIIFGTGPIGCAIAEKLQAFSVRCLGVSRTGQVKSPFEQVIPVSEVYSTAVNDFDFILLALPNNPGTHSLIDSKILERLDASVLINVGRAQVLVIADLLKALQKGQLAAAVLDVFEVEPLPPDSPLWSHPKISVTPHVSGLSQPDDVAGAFLAALENLEAGTEPALVVKQDQVFWKRG
jgi:phosphoglycerate dehydrogenase-like enzyme